MFAGGGWAIAEQTDATYVLQYECDDLMAYDPELGNPNNPLVRMIAINQELLQHYTP